MSELLNWLRYQVMATTSRAVFRLAMWLVDASSKVDDLSIGSDTDD